MSDAIKEIEARILTVAEPREKVDLLNSLSWELKLTDPNRGLEIASDANKISRELSYQKGLAYSYCYMGANYYNLSEFNKAQDVIDQAIILFDQIEDKKGKISALNVRGNILFRLCNFPAALQCHLESLNMSKEQGNIRGEAGSLNNIGNIYLELGDYETCLEYYLQSLKIKERLDSSSNIASSWGNIGLVYKRLGEYDKALEYQLKSFKIKQETGYRRGEIISSNNIGEIYLLMGAHEEALHWYQSGVKISEEVGEHFCRASLFFGIGQVYQKLGNHGDAAAQFNNGLDIARQLGDRETEQSILLCLGQLYGRAGNEAGEFGCLNQALAIAEELKCKPKIMESHQELSNAYKKLGDFTRALHHFQKYHETDKDVFNDASDKKRQSALIRFQADQKEKEAEIYRLRNVELAEANRAITQAKEIIEEKNRHITSSIEYARRIQQAVLPPAGKIQAALPEHFVLFKPRDIVSGDFYWFTQAGGKILIAVVDCTGHGVPGAFMSMIGSMLLNTIVNENGETGPAKILEQLHVAVRSALKQHNAEADTTDGMDVCLCAIEQGSKQLVYAGAKRPLYLVRNNELTEIAGDGKSIGGRQKEEKRAFSDKQLALQTSDMLYLTSDGYSDQCDAEGRKIGSRRLKELLIKISGQDPATQREALLAELERHQGEEEQRDDIAVLGVRISINSQSCRYER